MLVASYYILPVKWFLTLNKHAINCEFQQIFTEEKETIDCGFNF